MTENKQNRSHLALIPVLATWVICSKTCASSMIMTFLHCLQTKEGECKIRSRQHTTHARTMAISRDGEAYSMGRVFIHLLRLKGFCSGVLHSCFVRWALPHCAVDNADISPTRLTAG